MRDANCSVEASLPVNDLMPARREIHESGIAF
jgi:hypothetical protein